MAIAPLPHLSWFHYLQMARFSPTERIGISAVESVVLKELGWIFREQPIADVGIDAHIERVDDGKPTGKLVGVQIKTGLSHFREAGDTLVYYGDLVHLDYWTGHSLPVLLVAHIPETSKTFWAVINETTVTRTNKRWKIAIPKSNVFGSESRDELAHAFEGTPGEQRFRKLAIDEPLMRHIEAGGKVSVELEDWVNKSLGRTPVEVYVYDNQGNETLSQEWFTYYVGYGMKELAEAIFPWADAHLDEDFYEIHSDRSDDWLTRLRDSAEEEEYPREPGEDSEESIYPYSDSAGEVEHYRLMLTLNELGRAFLVVSDYLAKG